MKEQPKVKIRIAFVSPNAWTMYNFRKEVLQNVIDSGYEVIIIAEEDKYASLLISMGCVFVPIMVNNRSLKPTDDIRLFLKLRNIYSRHRPDFIFHYVIKPNIYGSLAAGFLKIPSIAIVTGLGHAFNKNNLLSFFIKTLYRYTLRYARQVWCLNAEDADFFIRNNIIPAKKITVLPGEGVNTTYFKRDNKTRIDAGVFTFLMSARLLKSKGIMEYAEATLLLKKKGLVFQSQLLGAIEHHPDAISEEHISSWREQNGLHYLGFTDDVRPYLTGADCFVYPSYYNEGVPRSLMEACSMELPVITTDNTGCRELIKNRLNGYLCKKQDSMSLARTMENLLQLSSAQRMAMGEEGRKIVESKYSMSNVITYYTDVLKRFFPPPIV